MGQDWLGRRLFYMLHNKIPCISFVAHLFYRKIHIFLQKARDCCLSFYVCQMFEQSAVYVRVM